MLLQLSLNRNRLLGIRAEIMEAQLAGRQSRSLVGGIAAATPKHIQTNPNLCTLLKVFDNALCKPNLNEFCSHTEGNLPTKYLGTIMRSRNLRLSP